MNMKKLYILAFLGVLGCGVDVPTELGDFEGGTSSDATGSSSSGTSEPTSSTTQPSNPKPPPEEDGSTGGTTGLTCNDGRCSGSTGETGDESTGAADTSGGPQVTTDPTGGGGGPASLPFDLEVDLGDTVLLVDAFALGGPLPAEVLEVTMDGGSWRLEELANGTPFTVNQADCDHEGNHGPGRDRLNVTWLNDDGSQGADELDIRYCGE